MQPPSVPATPPPPSNRYAPSTSSAQGTSSTPRNPYASPVPSTSYSYVPSTAISAGQEDFLWKRLWNFFSDELSLQKFSMAEIASGIFRVHIKGIEGKIEWRRPAVFDADRAGLSFREWVDQLTPLRYSGAPNSQEINKDLGKEFICWSLPRLF